MCCFLLYPPPTHIFVLVTSPHCSHSALLSFFKSPSFLLSYFQAFFMRKTGIFLTQKPLHIPLKYKTLYWRCITQTAPETWWVTSFLRIWPRDFLPPRDSLKPVTRIWIMRVVVPRTLPVNKHARRQPSSDKLRESPCVCCMEGL